jgi:uncharacterized protein YdaU (DUF1376 family)
VHYYKLNIGDWGLATGHLRVDEEGICLRLINYFISNEGPIPANTTQVFRKLRLTDVAELATAILEEFFVRNENGDWSHPSSVELIREYQDKADTSRENGKKGGRPRTPKPSEVHQTQNNPVGYQSEPTGNPGITLTTNQELLTTNHQPITNNNKQTEITETLFLDVEKVLPRRQGVTADSMKLAWNQAISAGNSPEQMLAGAKRYANFVQILRTENKYILSPGGFFGPDQKYLLEWGTNKTLPLGTDEQIEHAYRIELGADPSKSSCRSHREMRVLIEDRREKNKREIRIH